MISLKNRLVRLANRHSVLREDLLRMASAVPCEFWNLAVSGNPRTAQVLLKRLAKVRDWCEETGHCSTNLGIPRDEMPQIEPQLRAEFLHDLRRRGVWVMRERASVGSLRATQKEINAEKAEGIAQDKGRGWLSERPIMVSHDGYILDGHHRWAAMMLLGESNEIWVQRIGLPIEALLAYARSYEGVQFKGITDRKSFSLDGSLGLG